MRGPTSPRQVCYITSGGAKFTRMATSQPQVQQVLDFRGWQMSYKWLNGFGRLLDDWYRPLSGNK